MTERERIRLALMDAIRWQESLAYSFHSGDERNEAIADAKAYRTILKRRYGDSRLPMEIAMEGAKSVTLEELRSRSEAERRAAKEGENG